MGEGGQALHLLLEVSDPLLHLGVLCSDALLQTACCGSEAIFAVLARQPAELCGHEHILHLQSVCLRETSSYLGGVSVHGSKFEYSVRV